MGGKHLIILDTHTWIWYINDPGLLSKQACAQIEDELDNNPILVSSISVWEIFMLEKAGRLKLTLPAHTWVQKCENLSIFRFVPVDNEIAKISVQLNSDLHKDPADRIILATALKEGAILITKDKRLQNYSYVETVW